MTPDRGMNIDTFNRMVMVMNRRTMFIAGLLACSSALAGEFPGVFDPTRPATAMAYEADPVPVGPVLQSVYIAANIKRAIISGQTYTVGAHLGAAVVTDIRLYEVVLEQDGRQTTLRLVPRLAREMVPTSGMTGAKP